MSVPVASPSNYSIPAYGHILFTRLPEMNLCFDSDVGDTSSSSEDEGACMVSVPVTADCCLPLRVPPPSPVLPKREHHKSGIPSGHMVRVQDCIIRSKTWLQLNVSCWYIVFVHHLNITSLKILDAINHIFRCTIIFKPYENFQLQRSYNDMAVNHESLQVWMREEYTWCDYKITGLNFFPLPCKLGNSERCVLLACAVPSIHGYNFKVVQQTVWQ